MGIKSRDYTLDELLREAIESNRIDGVTNCPFTRWLRANVETSTIDAMREELKVNDEWGPEVCLGFIRTSHRHNAPEVACEIQRDYAAILVGHPFRRVRHIIETLLREKIAGGWDPDAQATLINALILHHRNPKSFLSQPEVRAKLPPLDFRIEDLKDADFT